MSEAIRLRYWWRKLLGIVLDEKLKLCSISQMAEMTPVPEGGSSWAKAYLKMQKEDDEDTVDKEAAAAEEEEEPGRPPSESGRVDRPNPDGTEGTAGLTTAVGGELLSLPPAACRDADSDPTDHPPPFCSSAIAEAELGRKADRLVPGSEGTRHQHHRRLDRGEACPRLKGHQHHRRLDRGAGTAVPGRCRRRQQPALTPDRPPAAAAPLGRFRRSTRYLLPPRGRCRSLRLAPALAVLAEPEPAPEPPAQPQPPPGVAVARTPCHLAAAQVQHLLPDLTLEEQPRQKMQETKSSRGRRVEHSQVLKHVSSIPLL